MKQVELPGGVVTYTNVGAVSLGSDGTDEYIRITTEPNEGITDRSLAMEFLDGYRTTGSDRAGSYFCPGGNVIPFPYDETQFVIIVHHRYDV